ncbi:MAG: MerR family transcriptional regulator [Clostridium sp.]|nr:MerR family transcriptional regulator [Clostridium sp.]
MKTYRTAEVASIIGVHPNTVRLYEKLGLIPKPERKPNGYRIFTDFHIEQFKLARLALQVEVLQNGLRKKIIQAVKASAAGDFNTAISLTEDYLRQLQQERTNAEKAIEIVKRILSGGVPETSRCFKRKEVSEYLDISVDSLRNWEMNGLITVKRKQNGYRVYTDEDIRKLIIIRTLRCANYSLEAILQMLRQLSEDPDSDIETILNTPKQDADIISVCDRLIISLSAAEENACKILSMLQEMKVRFL